MAKRRANGEGNLRKRKDGRWEGRYTAGYDPETGKRIIKNVLGKTQAEVREKLKQALELSQQTDVIRAKEYTVETWLRTWYDVYANPNVRLATAERYRLMIETYTIPRIGDIPLDKLKPLDLQRLYKELMESGRQKKSKTKGKGLSSTTVRSLHLMLHCALKQAVKERLILRNPTEDCTAPKAQKIEMKILPPEHISAYLAAAEKHNALPMFYIRFHDLRHTFATLALQNGVDAKTVSSMLGHYDAGFTLRTYTHATRQMQDEAAEKMESFMEQVM